MAIDFYDSDDGPLASDFRQDVADFNVLVLIGTGISKSPLALCVVWTSVLAKASSNLGQDDELSSSWDAEEPSGCCFRLPDMEIYLVLTVTCTMLLTEQWALLLRTSVLPHVPTLVVLLIPLRVVSSMNLEKDTFRMSVQDRT